MSANRAAQYGDQERLVRHIAEVVRRRMAGDDITTNVIVGFEPTERVVLGVLEPRRPTFEPRSHPDLPDEPGVPIDILPPSEIGVTVWVDPPLGATHIDFEVRATFAVYLPEFPTWAQQRDFMAGRRPTDDEGGEPDLELDDDDQTVGDNAVLGDSDHTQPPPHQPTTKVVKLARVFRRRDVAATFSISVPVDGTIGSDKGACDAELATVVADAANGRLAMLLTGRGKKSVPRAVVDAGSEAFEAELDERRTNDFPPLPQVEFVAGALRDPRGGWRVSLTLGNAALAGARMDASGQTIYDAGFSATLQTGELKNFGFRLADDDWRIKPEVFAHGRFCVGEVSDDRRTISTNTWPIYRDLVFESRLDLQPAFDDLATAPIAALDTIHHRMMAFDDEWATFAATEPLTTADKTKCLGQLAVFRDEAARFRRGIDLLQQDPRLLTAFIWANQAFTILNTPEGLNPDPTVPRGAPRITSWRLFQIVFIVNGLAALAAREHSGALSDELEIADVLWFPTGGGKSEAFLGLAAVAIFYDRLRSKAFGTSVFVRFPLRMLSVQQLERVLRVVIACEQIRSRESAHHSLGDPFELGYFVGRFNTPNTLTSSQDDRWQDITAMSKWTAEKRRQMVVITSCPFCGSTDVELRADAASVRLHHMCTACDRRIPVVVSDDEVFRTLPSVVVATVDKLAAVAFQPHFSHFTHGPAYKCPEHGYVTFAKGPKKERRCLARTFCKLEPKAWTPVVAYDPAPALIIQDELHLLSEELGTLAAHYETLFAHLCRSGSERPSKVIAATATISDYENQIHHLYALKPRRFPAEGFRQGETFYASKLDLPRRLYVGVLPSSFDTAQFGQHTAKIWRLELDRLRGLPSDDVIALLDLEHYTSATLPDLLFRYELQLFYANKKNDAERSHEQMRRLGNLGPSHFQSELLTGDTPLAEISAAIRRVEAESLDNTPNPADRLASVAGTSLVSHGVDLARLNVMHVAGMPSTNAYYVQATARAGRTDVGVVFMAFSRSFARDRSAFHFFEPQHAHSNQLVEAVSLNRFAVNAPAKTATGMLSSIIINRLARDVTLNAPVDNDIKNWSLTADFLGWLKAQQITVDATLIDEVLRAYGVQSPVLDPVVARYFAGEVEHRLKAALGELRGGTRPTIQKCFLNKPPSSFRDIDEAVEFGAAGYWSGKDFETLTGRRDVQDASEKPAAVEEEESS